MPVEFTTKIITIIMGLITGCIDSIAGGGGLISVPTLSLILGVGPTAIGTNKIVGFFAAFVALVVYFLKGHLNLKLSLKYGVWIGIGAYIGSILNPYVSKSALEWLIIFCSPIVLYLVLNKSKWLHFNKHAHLYDVRAFNPKLISLGLTIGIYDGIFGPGGGTFMLMGLVLVFGIDILGAISIAKFVNTVSAGASLFGYIQQGYVKYDIGLTMAIGVICGSFIGAHYAVNNVEKIIKPLFAFIVTLLVASIFYRKLFM